MARKLPLKTPSPTVEATRKRLGGRAASEPGAGQIVRVTTSLGLDKNAVVLFVLGDELDVWIADDTVLRTQRARTGPGPAVPPRELQQVAADARVFGSLREGQRVRYGRGDHPDDEATLVEKCRFGALLLRDDGTIMGIGFRRVWPLAREVDQN